MRKLFALVLLLVVFPLAGCASWGEHQQDDAERVIELARRAGGTIGGAAAGPAGVGIGEAIAGTVATALVGLAGVAGVRWGERRGWDEADSYNGRIWTPQPSPFAASSAHRRSPGNSGDHGRAVEGVAVG